MVILLQVNLFNIRVFFIIVRIVFIVTIIAAIAEITFFNHVQDGSQDGGSDLRQELHCQTYSLSGGRMMFDYQQDPFGQGRDGPGVGKADERRGIYDDMLEVLLQFMKEFRKGFGGHQLHRIRWNRASRDEEQVGYVGGVQNFIQRGATGEEVAQTRLPGMIKDVVDTGLSQVAIH